MAMAMPQRPVGLDMKLSQPNMGLNYIRLLNHTCESYWDYFVWDCFVCFLGTILSGTVLSGFLGLFCLGLFCLGIFCYLGLFCPGLFCLGLFCLFTDCNIRYPFKKLECEIQIDPLDSN